MISSASRDKLSLKHRILERIARPHAVRLADWDECYDFLAEKKDFLDRSDKEFIFRQAVFEVRATDAKIESKHKKFVARKTAEILEDFKNTKQIPSLKTISAILSRISPYMKSNEKVKMSKLAVSYLERLPMGSRVDSFYPISGNLTLLMRRFANKQSDFLAPIAKLLAEHAVTAPDLNFQHIVKIIYLLASFKMLNGQLLEKVSRDFTKLARKEDFDRPVFKEISKILAEAMCEAKIKPTSKIIFGALLHGQDYKAYIKLRTISLCLNWAKDFGFSCGPGRKYLLEFVNGSPDLIKEFFSVNLRKDYPTRKTILDSVISFIENDKLSYKPSALLSMLKVLIHHKYQHPSVLAVLSSVKDQPEFADYQEEISGLSKSFESIGCPNPSPTKIGL